MNRIRLRLNYSVELRYGMLADIAQMMFRGDPVDAANDHFNAIRQRDAVAQTLLAHEICRHVAVHHQYRRLENMTRTRSGLEVWRDFRGQSAFCGEEADAVWLSDSSSAQRLFGPPETTLEEMISWIAAWLQHGQATLGKPTGFENRDGNFRSSIPPAGEQVIPALPLAFDENRRRSAPLQRAKVCSYYEAATRGLAVVVHPTQFASGGTSKNREPFLSH